MILLMVTQHAARRPSLRRRVRALPERPIALLVALSATVVALCNVKDGNVVQAMAQAQAGAVDQWASSQSKSTKQHIAETTCSVEPSRQRGVGSFLTQ